MNKLGLGEYLGSINRTKHNMMRDGGFASSAEKQYPPFIVSRCLSYHPDAILFVNELNCLGLMEHNVSKKMHYEFLLYVLEKKNRFSKMPRSKPDAAIEAIQAKYGYSEKKAMEALSLFSDSQIENLIKQKGGK